ncbi:MAG: DNA polymerase III subunit beta [Clostridia bacterium]|nr:DNA polymerase III subunit beta [Clostridia bacterium]
MEALANVSRAAAPKSTLNIIEGIFMRAGRKGLYMCCYNLDMGIAKNINANVSHEGSVVMPIRLCEIVRRLPGERVSIEVDEKLRVHIKSDFSEFDIIGMPSIEFPELPTVDSEHSVIIPQGALRTMISQTSFAISSRTDKPVYTGALFEVEGGTMRAVTLDGFRVAVRIEEVKCDGTFNFIVPGKTLNELSKMLGDSDDSVEINVAKHNIIFFIDGYSIISRLMSGQFINYRTAFAVPAGSTEVRVKTSTLVAAIERIALVVSEKYKSPVSCTFVPDHIRFVCETAIGRAEDEISCSCPCDKVRIGFNARYMLDAFRAVDTDEIRLLVTNGRTPVQVLPPEGEHFMFLLMPVMLNENVVTDEEDEEEE